MPLAPAPLTRLGFLTIGVFDGDDPGPGHESLLRVIELGEELGFDSAWLRHRHLQFGVSSPIAIMAAATQAHPPHRTRYRRHAARLGEPAATGRRSGHRGHPVRWTAQPGHQRRPADELGTG